MKVLTYTVLVRGKVDNELTSAKEAQEYFEYCAVRFGVENVFMVIEEI